MRGAVAVGLLCGVAAAAAAADFYNAGTPAGVPRSYDCAVRKHAWAFGKQTLPRAGGFRTLYDALQLQACGVPAPEEGAAPLEPLAYPNPRGGVVAHVKSGAAAGGDGSPEAPYGTIQAAVDGVRGKGPATILLREGTHYTDGVVLGVESSDLVIQSYDGERATIAGGVPLHPSAAAPWTPHRRFNRTFTLHPGMRNVAPTTAPNATAAPTVYLGAYPTADACFAAGRANGTASYASWTWKAGECYGVTNANWAPVVDAAAASMRVEWQNVWALNVSGQNAGGMLGLRRAGGRAVRAKYPNGAQADSGRNYIGTADARWSGGAYTMGWVNAGEGWVADPDFVANLAKTTQYRANASTWPGVEWPMAAEKPMGTPQDTGMGSYGNHLGGYGGICAALDPPIGYWCTDPHPRGNIFRTQGPVGMGVNATLPQIYGYKNATGMVVHFWRQGKWFSNACEVARVDAEAGRVYFKAPCMQGGEGFTVGDAFYVENVAEECDYPGEYHYDDATETLLYAFNETEVPDADEVFVAVKTKVLFNISGTQAAPVRNVTIRGVTLRDAALTYVGDTVADRHGVPSAGDWALQKSGAVLLRGTEGVTVSGCAVTDVDGNGVMLVDYNRNATIVDNEFAWIGDTAMAAWGATGVCVDEACTETLPAAVGPDGRGGAQPRGTRVEGNIGREVGLFQKQSSMWFQAVTARTTLRRNVFFNGPRAGVNLNDGFGGGDVLEGNLILNMVRESGDHGPINTWNRLPYISEIGMVRNRSVADVAWGVGAPELPGYSAAEGRGSITGAFRQVRHNFVLGTYKSQEGIDNDDGSSHYLTHNNYFALPAVGEKSYANGRWNHQFRNVYAYAGTCIGVIPPAGENNAFYNNTCMPLTDAGYTSTCAIPAERWAAGGIGANKVFTPTAAAKVCAGDNGTTVGTWLSDAALTAAAVAALAPFPLV